VEQGRRDRSRYHLYCKGYEDTSERTILIQRDVHVHRICGRLGWVKNAKDPEQTVPVLRSVFF
jgi:hypothetical protein